MAEASFPGPIDVHVHHLSDDVTSVPTPVGCCGSSTAPGSSTFGEVPTAITWRQLSDPALIVAELTVADLDAELVALTDHGLSGVAIPPQLGEVRLDQPPLRQLLERCEARGRPVLVHPIQDIRPGLDAYYLNNLLGNGSETAAAIGALLLDKAGPDRLLLGSDRPFDMGSTIRHARPTRSASTSPPRPPTPIGSSTGA